MLEDVLHISNFKMVDDLRIRIYEAGMSPGIISRTLTLQGVIIEEITKKNHSLEDYFLTLINGGGIGA